MNTREINTDEEKLSLKDGDVIRFYDSFSGGFKLGIVKKMELEKDCYHSGLNIWRPVTEYYLGSPGVRAITVLETKEDVKDREWRDLENLLGEAEENHISFTFGEEKER